MHHLLDLKSRSGETRPDGKFLHARLKGVLPGGNSLHRLQVYYVIFTVWLANFVHWSELSYT